MPVRRLVTGHVDNKKAVFVSDEEVTPRMWPGSNFEFLRLWGGDAERIFPGLMSHLEQSSPAVPTSNSIDLGYIISYPIWLELGYGIARELRAGDTYVQNGTRHDWRNRGSEPCSILGGLIAAGRDPFG